MSGSRPKTIQIFLPDGNARSVRVAEVTSRTVQAVQVPRSKLNAADERDEVQRVGVYFLFGETEDNPGKPVAYIGEAENCYERLVGHHREKEFWNTALVITSKTQSFTKAHARYLEYDCSGRREMRIVSDFGIIRRLPNHTFPSRCWPSFGTISGRFGRCFQCSVFQFSIP